MLFRHQLECFSSLLEPMTNNWNDEKLEHIRYIGVGTRGTGESRPPHSKIRAYTVCVTLVMC